MNSDSPTNASADLFIGSVVRLARLFYDDVDLLGSFEPVPASDLTDDARTLLAHNNHMTVTLEAFHNSLVDVEVLDQWQDGSSYARKILLIRQSDRAVVQFGIMRIWLTDLPGEARDEILSRSMPLGRTLIRHNLLREVQLVHLWRIRPGADLRQHLQLDASSVVYGRTAEILVDQRPTVQLLEIVAERQGPSTGD